MKWSQLLNWLSLERSIISWLILLTCVSNKAAIRLTIYSLISWSPLLGQTYSWLQIVALLSVICWFCYSGSELEKRLYAWSNAVVFYSLQLLYKKWSIYCWVLKWPLIRLPLHCQQDNPPGIIMILCVIANEMKIRRSAVNLFERVLVSLLTAVLARSIKTINRVRMTLIRLLILLFCWMRIPFSSMDYMGQWSNGSIWFSIEVGICILMSRFFILNFTSQSRVVDLVRSGWWLSDKQE
jgi:hypothetical protein